MQEWAEFFFLWKVAATGEFLGDIKGTLHDSSESPSLDYRDKICKKKSTFQEKHCYSV